MKYHEYEKEVKEKLSPEIADVLLSDVSIWSNNACNGYCIIAMRAAGYNDKQITEVLQNMHYAFEDYSVEDAERKAASMY